MRKVSSFLRCAVRNRLEEEFEGSTQARRW